ncbi:MAG: protease inhibitor I42 family protein [Comamonadaceae bacterium]|nr:protease inhibitor I42 family protein [Comamonadaceae bacterium]
MLSITETENGRTVDIRRGEAIRINLPENAPGGYRWAIDHYNKGVLESAPAVPQQAAGIAAFVFKGKKTGSGEVTLKYWRQREGDASVIKRFHIRLHVQP